MAERSQVTQVFNIGVESTPGTAVAAPTRLQSVDFTDHIQATMDQYRPMGFKYLTVDAESKEWIAAGLTGVPSYNEMQYLLASLMSDPGSPTSLGSGAYKYIFDSSTSAPDTQKTFTIEHGSSVRAHRYPFSIVHELGISITRDKVDLNGAIIAQRLQDNVALTGSPTQLTLVPAVSPTWDIFLDTTSGGLGTTKLNRVFTHKWDVKNRSGAFWTVDSSQTSYAGVVELPATIENTVLVEADAQGMALLSNLRAGTTNFLRMRSVGPLIGGSFNYSITIDMAVKVGAPEPFTNHEGIFAVGFKLDGVHDSGWGKAYHAEVVNSITAL